MFSPRLGFRKKSNNYSTWTFGQVFHNPNPYTGASNQDLFGASANISSNYMIIGAFQEDSATSAEDGRAYVYKLLDKSLLYEVANPNTYSANNPGTGDRFGYSVAINNTYFAVSAHQEDTSNTLTSSGAVYVFNISDGSLRTTITDPNAYSAVTADFFGYRIAMTDDYLICSAPYEDVTGKGSESGVVYVYSLSDMSLYWTIDNPNTDGGTGTDYFGADLDASGDYLIIGAPGAGSVTNIGAAYVYKFSDKSTVYSLSNPNTDSQTEVDYFGSGVAISKNYFAISAPAEDAGSSTNNYGYVYVYDLATGSLKYSVADPATQGTGDAFGGSGATATTVPGSGGALDVNDRYLVVGCRLKDTDGTDSGRAYVYDLQNYASGPQTINCPNSYGSAGSDAFGRQTRLSADRLLVTSLEDDATGSVSGKAYMYSLNALDDLYASRTPKHITRFGDTKNSTTQTKYGTSSVYFDGTGDYLSIPDSADWDLATSSVTSWTIEAWIYLTDATTIRIAGAQTQTGTDNGWMIMLDSGYLSWVDRGNASNVYYADTGGITTNTWTHIAIVRDSSTTLRMFQDGTRVYNNTSYTASGLSSSAALTLGQGQGISGGAWAAAPTFFYYGYIDDFRLSHTARYTGNFTAPSSLVSDSSTKLLIKGDGPNNSTIFTDYTLPGKLAGA